MKIGELCITVDRVLDYVPFVSSVTNLVDLFQKIVTIPEASETTEDKYYTYLRKKDSLRCVVLLIPILGNIIVLLNDIGVCKSEHNEPASGSLVPSTTDDPELSTSSSDGTDSSIEKDELDGANPETTRQFNQIISQLKPDLTLQQMRTILEEPTDFFTNKGQKIAKDAFQKAMKAIGLDVSYVTAWDLDTTVEQDCSWTLPQSDIFSWVATKGVQYDIPNASKEINSVHLFSVASQYNCAEAAKARTPKIGCANSDSQSDHSQGPFAQRTNPKAFELALAFLTHLGFNMMDKVLPASVGKTYPEEGTPEKREDSKTAILHGYLQPAGWFNDETASPEKKKEAIDDITIVTEHMKQNLHLFETVCYSSLPDKGGENPVYLILAAAPNINLFGYSDKVKEFQYWAAVANFTTQFTQLRDLATKNPKKTVVLHVTLPGLGAFSNDAEMVAKAFNRAARCFYDTLTDQQKKLIRVEVSVFTSNLENGIDQDSHTFLECVGLPLNGVKIAPKWS